MLVSINDIDINANNLEIILSAIKKRQSLNLIMLSPLTYLNLNTNDLIFEKLNLSDKLKNKMDKNMITATSKSTMLVKGDRVKLPDNQLNEEVFYLIMILSLNKEKIKRKENANEKVIFVFNRKIFQKIRI